MKRKDNHFLGKKIFVGIDVHKLNWRIAILFKNKILRTFSQRPDPVALAAHLNREYPGAIVSCAYEAGFCGFWIYEKLAELNIECKVLHAADIPTTDKENRFKTDKRDCRKIAICCQNPFSESIHIPLKEMQYSRSLVRVRKRISQDIVRIKNRIKSHLYFFGADIRYRLEAITK